MRYPLIEHRNAVVTGCSSGIGLATALRLRDARWNVCPTARRPDDLEMLRAKGFRPVAMDLGDEASVAAGAAAILKSFDGRLGALVNNAGYGQPGALEDLPRAALREQFEVNLFGLQDLTNRLLPAFRRLGRGRIVNVSSVVGRVALPFMGAYSGSKFALEAFSDAMRVELTGTGIAVCLIEPGPIETRFGDRAVEAGTRRLSGVESPFSASYRHYLRRLEARNERPDPFRQPPAAVAVKILHAVSSARPRRRYPVTVPAHLGRFLARFAPAAFIDAVMRRRLRDRFPDGARRVQEARPDPT
jgi:NAD(P)-dependent dehydrogenase (short-subunit alcohol dehydrogenase family)